MTTGQIVGGIVGGVVAYATGGNVALGYTVGSAIGGVLDPPKGPTITGPRLSDLSVQLSTYGAPLARCYGTVPIVGNIFWLENDQLKEVVTKKKSGGKGGPTSTTKTYSYYATFAVALADTTHTGPIAGIRRIWIGSILWYNAGSDDLETIIASNQAADGFRFYNGSRTQQPDPRMQADVGVDDCPAYRDTAYIVFYDLPLEKWSNSLQAAQVKVEIVMQANAVGPCTSFKTWATALPGHQTQQDRGSIHISGGVLHNWQSDYVYRYRLDGSYIDRRLASTPGGYTNKGRCVNNAWLQLMADGASDLFINDYRSLGITGPLLSHNDNKVRAASGGGGALLIDLGDGRLCVGGIEDASGTPGVLVIYDDGVAVVGINPSFQITHTAGGCTDGDYIYVWSITGTLYAYDIETLDEVNSWSVGHAPAHYTQWAPSMAVSDGFAYLYCENPPSTLARVFQLGDTGSIAELCTIPNAGYARIDDGIIVSLTNPAKFYRTSGATPELIDLADIVSAELQLSNLIEAGDIDVSGLTDTVRGYRVAGGSIRSALEPLQGSHPFDIIPSGYKIKAVPRGGSSVAAIDIGELGSVAGSSMADVVLDGPVREMDTQLPRKLVIKHLDPARDYDINEQSAERQSTDSIDIETRELPEVMTPDEAAGVAQTLLYLRWLERNDYAFALPPTYSNVEPADVVTVESDDASIPLRLTEIAYGADGVIQCKAKPNSPAIYTPNAVGGQGATPDGSVSYIGDSTLILMDIPLLRNQDDEPGIVAAMAGLTLAWPGGAALRSLDQGQTWDDIQAWDAPGTFGVARDALTTDDGYIVDAVSTLAIDFIAGEPESISDTQFWNGYNYFAYGVDGRWEILQARDIELQSDGSYIASHFLRGLRGTEWATGLHQAGDYFVLLEDPDNAFIGISITELQILRKWRGVTVGQLVDDVDDISFAYRGVNLRPLSPVLPAGIVSNADWQISWTRRSRLLGTLWSTGTDLPLGEESESYEVDILDGSDVVRTLTSTGPSAIYTESQQIEDFGSAQSLIEANIYQIGATVGRGFPCRAILLSEGSDQDLFITNSLSSYTEVATSAASWVISGGELVATNGSQAVLLRNGVSIADTLIEVDVNYARDGGLVLRHQNVSNYYMLSFCDDSGADPTNNLKIWKRVSGTFTLIAQTGIAWTRGTSKRIGFRAAGTSLRGYVDGVQIVSGTDSAHASAGGVGMRNNETGGITKYQAFRWNMT